MLPGARYEMPVRHSEHRRIDHRGSLLIDAAINASQSHELIPVAEGLVEQGIAPDAVLRVLIKPERRRYVETREPYPSKLFH
ncbi:hypothetical protein [Massilia sp. Root335]|uniref:hypothetical protein n=1 Tax=Massilia sp. Root335 TaxID=1736517 RepID=UPI0012F69D1F|nr:hypothetical protein [Massilia sp. Root335]